jgi:hypothetical protein
VGTRAADFEAERMSEHTKEPWFFSEWSDEFVPIRTKSGRIVCDVGYADTDQINIFNARRIVACVNACAGIPTGMLEAAGQSAVIALRPVDELVAERNALLAALKVIACNADMYLPATIRQVATEAIAQVKL